MTNAYKVETNMTLFYSTIEEARNAGQKIHELQQEDSNGGVQLHQLENGTYRRIPLKEPEKIISYRNRQDCLMRLEKLTKELNEIFPDKFTAEELGNEVVVLAPGTTTYEIDYKLLYANFTQIIGTDSAEDFKTALTNVLLKESLRGIKGITV